MYERNFHAAPSRSINACSRMKLSIEASAPLTGWPPRKAPSPAARQSAGTHRPFPTGSPVSPAHSPLCPATSRRRRPEGRLRGRAVAGGGAANRMTVDL